MLSSLSARYDAVVIGSGHNGLVAAAYLARAGKSVLVIERNAEIGGATASQQVFPDYDAWLSRYSYLVSLFPQQIVRDLGLSFTTRRRNTASFTPWTDSAGAARGLVLSNVDEDRSRESMLALTGKHETWDRYQEFVSLQSEIAKLVWPTLLQPLASRDQLAQSCQTHLQRRAWKTLIEQPLGESIESVTDNDALRGLLMTDGKIGVFTHPHDESLLQNRCFLYHVIGGGNGEWRVPVGGMRSLTQSLEACCRSAGVDFLCGATAKHIDTGREHRITFDHNGTERDVSTTNVLINASPRVRTRLLGESWSPSDQDEGSVVKINMLLRHLPRLKTADTTAEEAFAGSFHVDEGYEQMLRSRQTAMRGEIPDPAPGEVYCHTLTDESILSPELRQAGFQTLTLFGLDMPYRLFESDHDARKQHVLDLYMQGLSRLTVEPFEDCLAADRNGNHCVEIKTPQELEREVGLDRGNIFHNELTWFWADDSCPAGATGAWGVETETPGIYIAGSSALRGGAVSGIPGHNAAQCILQSG
ncbi:MAG TPA: FAD-dependent oxidoreductase [Planctomycetaceae bacterium]|nr:FAD-dependent oxidoreductase [Planctomycetaceae bacterium]